MILTSFGKLLRARHIFSIELNTRQVLLAGVYLLTFFLQEATLVSAEIIEQKIRYKSIKSIDYREFEKMMKHINALYVAIVVFQMLSSIFVAILVRNLY